MYENTTVLTLEDFIVLQTTWERFKSPFRKLKKMQRICFILPGIILIIVGAMNLWTVLRSWDSSLLLFVIMGIVFILLGLLLIFWPSGSGLAKRNWKKYQDKGKEQVFCFAKDRFYLRTDSGNFDLEYTAVKDIMEDKRVFLLFFSDQVAYVLHKDGFTSGDAESFGSFLAERTGLTIRQL